MTAAPLPDAVSHEEPAADLAPFLAHLRAAGVSFTAAAPLAKDDDEPGRPHDTPMEHRELVIPGLPPMSERRRGRIGSDHATWSVAADLVRHRLIAPGATVWEIGAGTAMLSVVAHHLGAGRLVVTDVDASAMDVAAENLASAGAQAHMHVGSLLDAVPGTEPPPDVVVANLPHKPRRAAGSLPLAEDGGPEGDALLRPFWSQAAQRMPSGARLVFFQHSLPHPRNLVALAREFDLRLLSWKRRFLASGEYGALQEWFVERSSQGRSYLAVDAGGRRFLVACGWLATRR